MAEKEREKKVLGTRKFGPLQRSKSLKGEEKQAREEKKDTEVDLRIGHIKVFEGEEKQDRVYPLTGKAVFYAGRSSEVDIPLSDMKVSRKHCKIEKKGSRYRVTDLGSRNGTYLNGKRIRTELLSDGDQIRIGFTVLQFFLAEPGTHIVESKMQERTCALCGCKVSEADILSNKAEELDGNVYCAKCVESVEAEGGGEMVATTPTDLKPPITEMPTQRITESEKQKITPSKQAKKKEGKKEEEEKKEESLIEFEEVKKAPKPPARSSQETIYDIDSKGLDEIVAPPKKDDLPDIDDLNIEELLEE
jgi:hypothetical protein